MTSTHRIDHDHHAPAGPLATRVDGLRHMLQARVMAALAAQSQKRLRTAVAGRYRVFGELGRGGMAVVYAAFDLGLERPVALKLLDPRAGPKERERFLREARIAARLSHPNIVPIHAVERAGEFVFFTMDYVEGETLAQRVRMRGPLPVGQATRVMHDVARAVGYAHARGVVHRDLNAANIMLESGSDRPIVMDFGIALARAQPDFVPPGYVVGTARFMSPEQVTGGDVDERSDVYALGVTAYYAVTGELPFDSDSTDEIFRQHVEAPAPALAAYGQNLDLTYSQAVARCLEKHTARRFTDGDDLADALAAAPEIRGRDLPVPLQAFVERLHRHSASTRGMSVLVALALFSLLGGIMNGSWGMAAWVAGFLGVVVASAGIALLPMTRRVLRAGFGRADIVHALSVELARERALKRFEYGGAPAEPARVARLAAYGGLGVVGVGAALSFVQILDPIVGMVAMAYGGLISLGASVIGVRLARSRLNRVGDLWLGFWRSRAGEWATRLAGLGLGARPLPVSRPHQPAVSQPRQSNVRLAPRWQRHLSEWAEGAHTFETGERDSPLPADRPKMSQ